MMGFAKNNPFAFRRYSFTWPFLIGLMKYLGALLTEIVNIYLIAISNDISDIIMNFIALGVIAEIDDIVGTSVSEINISEENSTQVMFDERQIWENEFNNIKRSFKTHVKEKRWVDFAVLIILTTLYTIWKVYNYCIHYYFAPFTIIFIVFTQGGYEELKPLI